MPSGANWGYFIYVNIAFIICIIVVFYYSQIGKIKANWPLYRCNPLYMFLADNIQGNAKYCYRKADYKYIIGYIFVPIKQIIQYIKSKLRIDLL